MNLYFVDGADIELNYVVNIINPDVLTIYRGGSYKHNSKKMDLYVKSDVQQVFSNDETLLSNPIFYNPTSKRYNIWFWIDDQWVYIHDIYENLRQENDLTKMFYCGKFDKETK